MVPWETTDRAWCQRCAPTRLRHGGLRPVSGHEPHRCNDLVARFAVSTEIFAGGNFFAIDNNETSSESRRGCGVEIDRPVAGGDKCDAFACSRSTMSRTEGFAHDLLTALC